MVAGCGDGRVAERIGVVEGMVCAGAALKTGLGMKEERFWEKR